MQQTQCFLQHQEFYYSLNAASDDLLPTSRCSIYSNSRFFIGIILYVCVFLDINISLIFESCSYISLLILKLSYLLALDQTASQSKSHKNIQDSW